MMVSTRTVRRARAGVREAEDDLFRACWPIAWTTAYSILGSSAPAEDAAQAAVVSVFRSLDRFDDRRPLEPWLKRIAANAAITELRKLSRQPLYVPEPGLYRDATAPAPDSHLPDGLIEAVATLPDAARLVIVLYYWLDHSISEIADLLGVPPGTVASRRARALDQLRMRMEGEKHVRS